MRNYICNLSACTITKKKRGGGGCACSVVTVYANIKWCDTKIVLKSHLTDNISNNAYPKFKKKKNKNKNQKQKVSRSAFNIKWRDRVS